MERIPLWLGLKAALGTIMVLLTAFIKESQLKSKVNDNGACLLFRCALLLLWILLMKVWQVSKAVI